MAYAVTPARERPTAVTAAAVAAAASAARGAAAAAGSASCSDVIASGPRRSEAGAAAAGGAGYSRAACRSDAASGSGGAGLAAAAVTARAGAVGRGVSCARPAARSFDGGGRFLGGAGAEEGTRGKHRGEARHTGRARPEHGFLLGRGVNSQTHSPILPPSSNCNWRPAIVTVAFRGRNAGATAATRGMLPAVKRGAGCKKR